MATNMLETELFTPVKHYLESHGYAVNAEVKDCDVVATRDDELIVVELKTSANMQLLIQATARLKITDSVYVAVPRVTGKRKHWTGVQRVLRRLEIGLLVVTFGSLGASVTKLFDPLPYQGRKRSKNRREVIKEIADRSGEYNIGGSTRVKLITAYRENAILVATCLERLGEASPRGLRLLGTGDKTPAILSKNHYGWFQRIDRGVYSITDQGRQEIRTYPDLHQRSLDFLDDSASK
jgi:hypothetical protein